MLPHHLMQCLYCVCVCSWVYWWFRLYQQPADTEPARGNHCAGWCKCIISLLRLQFGSWSHVNARDAWLYSCCNINHSHNLPPCPCSTTSHPTACIEQLKAQVQQQQQQQINIICSQWNSIQYIDWLSWIHRQGRIQEFEEAQKAGQVLQEIVRAYYHWRQRHQQHSLRKPHVDCPAGTGASSPMHALCPLLLPR